MVSSAVYRYFPSRDDLLTELIIDAYADLAAVVDTADQQLPRSRYAHRWMRRCGAMRQWALGQPHRFHLLYGSPLPDYRAPTETVSPAVGVIAAFLAPLADAAVAGVLSPPPAPRRRGLRHQLAVVAAELDVALPSGVLARAVRAFAAVIGLIMLELGGHFVGGFEPADQLFEASLTDLAAELGFSR